MRLKGAFCIKFIFYLFKGKESQEMLKCEKIILESVKAIIFCPGRCRWQRYCTKFFPCSPAPFSNLHLVLWPGRLTSDVMFQLGSWLGLVNGEVTVDSWERGWESLRVSVSVLTVGMRWGGHCSLALRLHFNLVASVSWLGLTPAPLLFPQTWVRSRGRTGFPHTCSCTSPSLVDYLNPPQTFINRFSLSVFPISYRNYSWCKHQLHMVAVNIKQNKEFNDFTSEPGTWGVFELLWFSLISSMLSSFLSLDLCTRCSLLLNAFILDICRAYVFPTYRFSAQMSLLRECCPNHLIY